MEKHLRRLFENELALCMMMFVPIMMVYSTVYHYGLQPYIQPCMLVLSTLLVSVLVFCAVLKYDQTVLLWIVIILGFVVRIGYALYTPCNVRSHDLYNITSDGCGHAAYILTLMDGRLPSSNQGQFYHPPLFHGLCAAVAAILKPILKLTSDFALVDCGRIVSCVFSCMSLLIVERICAFINADRLLPVTLVAFLPSCYLMGGRVNNDATVTFFMLMIVLYSIRWFSEQNWRSTIMLALSFGLGMLSKASAGVLALPTGTVMLYIILMRVGKRDFRRLMRKLTVFLLISVPLGLSYAVRNFCLFSQPIGYVLNTGGVGSLAQYHTAAERFLTAPISELCTLYNDPHTDYNVWVYLLKGALFGEFIIDTPLSLYITLLLCFAVIAIFLILTTVRWVCQLLNFYAHERRYQYTSVIYFLLVLFTMFYSYIGFNIAYPYGCTMDFRYFVLVYIVSCILLGSFRAERSSKIVSDFLRCVVIIFSFISVFIYCTC